MMRKFILLSVVALLLAGCGTAATPEWAAEVQGTQVALAETAAYETAIAPTATPTDPPTETPVPPTATPVPPTDTPEPPTNTPEPATATFTPTPLQAAADDDEFADEIAAALAAGDVARGDELFHTLYTEVGFACSTCHNVDNPNRLIGPSLQDIGQIARTRVPGQGPVEYLHESIVDPNAFIVPPDAGGAYPENLMPQVYGDLFTEQEIADIIAYLLTL